MNDKEKFEFVNENLEDQDFLLEDEDSSIKEPTIKVELTEEELKLRKRKNKRKFILKSTVIMSAIVLVLLAFIMVWQWKLTLMAFSNGLAFVTILLFTAGWIMFVYNHNVFSPLIHGLKTFGLMMVGKTPKEKYYDYMKKIEENPIPNYIYKVTFITAFIVLIPAVITFIMVL